MSPSSAFRARDKRSGTIGADAPSTGQEAASTPSVSDAPGKGRAPPAIYPRIRAALEKVRVQGLEVRAIYLDEADRDELRREVSRYWRKRLGGDAEYHPSTVERLDGTQVLLVSADLVPVALREGGRSIVYTTQGVGFTVPKRLSRKVA